MRMRRYTHNLFGFIDHRVFMGLCEQRIVFHVDLYGVVLAISLILSQFHFAESTLPQCL